MTTSTAFSRCQGRGFRLKIRATTRSSGRLTAAKSGRRRIFRRQQGEMSMPDMPAIAVLGRKLDSIPFSPYHIAVILVLGLVGFTDGYDLALTGSLLVLAKGPLHITPDQIRWLTIAATMFVVVGGFIAAAISDHVSRKTIIQIGV